MEGNTASDVSENPENPENSDEISQKDSRKRELGNAGRCTKKSSKATYSKKRKYHGKRTKTVADVVSSDNNKKRKSSVPVSQRKIKRVYKLPRKQSIQGFRFVDMQIMQDIISDLCCPQCYEVGTLYMEETSDKKKGLSSHLTVTCDCGYEKETYTSRTIKTETSERGMKRFEVNVRGVYAMRTVGLDHTGLEKICCMMNIPKPMTVKNFNNISDLLGNAAKTVAEKSMNDAVTELKKSKNIDILDIGVSVDGTWQRRGFSSLNGVVAAISVDNGKVIDVEPMSRYCRECAVNTRRLQDDEEALEIWKARHRDDCKLTCDGSAPSMEPEGTRRIFSRSIEIRRVRYIGFYGDGDSKAFLVVEDIYGNIKVIKFECIGHYQKRVGCRLRKLKKRIKGLRSLTEAIIDKLQNYFGIALRCNCTSVDEMAEAIMASLFHVCSSKDRNLHDHCMKGPNSWCQYQRDISNKTNLYRPGPGLTDEVIKHVKPIYLDLIKPQVLAKCLHGMTQNQNESFNSMIWERIPKYRYCSYNKLKFGVYDAVCNFNDGRQASLEILKKANVEPGYYTTSACISMNIKRKRSAVYHHNSAVQKARKIIRAQRKRKVDKNKKKEGNVYKSGGY